MYSYFWAAALTVGMAGTWLVLERQARKPVPDAVAGPVLGVVIAACVCAIIVCLRTATQFIYFQF